VNRRLALPLLWLLAGSGCISITADAELGPRISPAVLEQIVPGRADRAQVLERLGPPDEYLRSEVAGALGDDTVRVSGAVRLGNRAIDVLTWRYDRMRVRGRWWLFFLGLDTTVRSDLLMIVFDEDELVREVSFREAVE
jgi:hypothetical protein